MTPSKFGDDDYRAILTFRDQLRRFLRWSDGAARRVGITPAQHQLLLAVRGHPGGELPTISDLAGHLQLRHHSAVGLIDRAVANGLVERLRDDEDGRVVRIQLLGPGEDALEELTGYHVVELKVLMESFADFKVPGADDPA